jgi:hypothetical protein
MKGKEQPVGLPAVREGSVYPLVYWTGVATTLVWVAFSAYSALNGL